MVGPGWSNKSRYAKSKDPMDRYVRDIWYNDSRWGRRRRNRRIGTALIGLCILALVAIIWLSAH